MPELQRLQKRGCLRQISIKEEAEQLEINESLEVNENLKRIVAKLPWRCDPEAVLTDNQRIAENALERLCTKYDDKSYRA